MGLCPGGDSKMGHSCRLESPLKEQSAYSRCDWVHNAVILQRERYEQVFVKLHNCCKKQIKITKEYGQI